MAPGDWAQYARALRRERKTLQQQADENPAVLDAVQPAVLMLGALENAAMSMAGGYVYD